MVSDPEVARLVNEFAYSLEVTKGDQGKKPDCRHKQREGVQKPFKKQVKSLSTTITEMGNPFHESTNDLLVLDTQDMMLPSVVENIRKCGTKPISREARREARSKSLFEPIIKQNNLFQQSPPDIRGTPCCFTVQDFPPSLSTYGDIRTGTKSDMLQCLEKDLVSPSQNDIPDVDMLLLDGAVIVNILRPRAAKTVHIPTKYSFLFKVSGVVVIGTES